MVAILWAVASPVVWRIYIYVSKLFFGSIIIGAIQTAPEQGIQETDPIFTAHIQAYPLKIKEYFLAQALLL